MTTVIYRCPDCKTAVRVPVNTRNHNGETQYEHDGAWFPWIPHRDCCRREMRATAVLGTYRPNQPCGQKCRESLGPICRCACAGENHGAAWERKEA